MNRLAYVHHGCLLHKTVDFIHLCKIHFFICSGDAACPLFDNHHTSGGHIKLQCMYTSSSSESVKAKPRVVNI